MQGRGTRQRSARRVSVPIVALSQAQRGGKDRAISSSLNGNLSWGWDDDLARQMPKAVNWAAGNPVTLPGGVGGEAFAAKGMIFLALQDIKYSGSAAVNVRVPAGACHAAGVFAGTSVPVAAAGEGNVVITPVLPPNGSASSVL